MRFGSVIYEKMMPSNNPPYKWLTAISAHSWSCRMLM